MSVPRALAPLALCLSLATAAAAQSSANILVFDGSIHQNALQAAQVDHPLGVTIATATDFQSKLNGSSWDAVVVSMPGSGPTVAYPDLAAYIAGGGKAILALWDWDDNAGFGSPVINTAFEVQPVQDITLVSGLTQLQDSQTSSVFASVTMPVSDWHNHSADDGDLFSPTGSAYGLAHIGDPAKPILVLGNQGRTIAAPLLTECGDTWLNDGSALRLWRNMLDLVLTGGCPASTASLVKRFGSPANPDALLVTPGAKPLMGQVFQPYVDHTTFMPSAILDVLIYSAGQVNIPTIHGTLLADLSLQLGFQVSSAGQGFALPVPFECAFAGVGVTLQAGSVAVGQLELTNALDVVIGSQ